MGRSAPPRHPKSPDRELLERAVHDLKNPLAVVRASLEWLAVELVDREEALDAVGDATTAAERLMTIVDDLDALARLERDGIAAGDPVALGPLVDAVVAAASTKLARRKITVEAVAPGALATTGDGRLLLRSLTALVDATARGAPNGSCIEVTVSDGAAASGGRAIEIGVALRGTADAGAAVRALDALESSGLGVCVALRVVEAHGGSLEVIPTASLPRICVRLPV